MESDDTEPLLSVQAFNPNRHERTGFSSGVSRIDNFLKRTARKHQDGDFTRVWVACLRGERRVLGCYAINAHAVEAGELPDGLRRGAPRHGSVPGAYLSMVGADTSFQRRGLGRALLVDALGRIEAASRTVGIKAVVLDVIDDGGSDAFLRRLRFYERMGFVSFPSRPTRMFIAMSTVRDALSSRAHSKG